MAHPLQHSWAIWENKDIPKGGDWSHSLQKVCEFSTVEEFWRTWSFIPRPSEVFSNNERRKDLDRTLNAFSVFKAGIKPEWEDPANAKGSQLDCRKTMNLTEIDAHWENMVLACIGEMIDENDEICGCRVVDKTKKGGGSSRSIFRLELWLRSSNDAVAETIKNRLLEVLADGDKKAVGRLGFEYSKRS